MKLHIFKFFALIVVFNLIFLASCASSKSQKRSMASIRHDFYNRTCNITLCSDIPNLNYLKNYEDSLTLLGYKSITTKSIKDCTSINSGELVAIFIQNDSWITNFMRDKSVPCFSSIAIRNYPGGGNVNTSAEFSQIESFDDEYSCIMGQDIYQQGSKCLINSHAY